MLKLKNVSKYYYQGGVIAEGFVKVNLELHLGEFVVITGESGSGKSTLLNVLSGLDSYEDGEMYINGEETSHYTEEDYLEYRRKYVSNIFQNFNLVNSYTVYENIELAMLMNGKNKKDVKKDVLDLIDKVGLKKYKNTVTSKLSGGQKQRVAIARALANDTPIIVADEPTGSLDSKASAAIIKLLHEISQDKLVIVVTHNKEEIEKYATRLIRMHDGKILENKVVTKINLDSNLKAKEVNDITRRSKIKLGIRNAFNLPVKFILMLVIFFLIAMTLLTNYASFKEAEDMELVDGINYYFTNTSDKRIVLTKKDKTVFTDDDYNKINKLDNIDYLVKEDILNDQEIYLESDYLYLDGTINLQEYDKVDEGNLISKKNEMLIILSPDSWYASDLESLLAATYKLENSNLNNIKIVGVVYDAEMPAYNTEFVLSDELRKDVELDIAKNTMDIEYTLNNYYFSNYGDNYLDIAVNNHVPSGEVYVKDELNTYCHDYNCLNEIINVKVKNIYYEDNLDLKVTNVITKDNAKNLDIDYDSSYNMIYLNSDDYNKLFYRGNYQSSVFVKEIKDLDNTVESLNNLGYKTLKIRDTKLDEAEIIKQIFNIFKLVVVVFLIITLFFISYFIMKIIYKSRNSYYTTLRTLGGTKSVCIKILRNELITLATITYTLIILLISLVKWNVINISYFQNLAKYISIGEYLVVYIILLLLSILMSNRYGRKIFKNSIIKTYGERI